MAAPASPAGPGTVLVERGAALETLARALAAAAGGAGATVLVTGEAGIGKTALVEHFVVSCGAPRVLWGACEALHTPRPLGPLHDIAHRTGGRLQELLAAGAEREAVFAACLAELERTPGPALVVVEDVHWADEATLDLLRFLGRRVPRLPTLIVATYRDDELTPDHPLRALLGTLPPATVQRVALPRLSPDAVAGLARPAGRDAEALYRVSGGNPFFVSELLRAAPGAVPPSVKDAVLARAARLTGAARDVLEAASVVPGHAERWLLAGLGSDDAAAIDACLATGVLQPSDRDRAVAFRHELARLAVLESLPAERVRGWHARVLAVLEREQQARDVSLSRLVHHAGEAGDGAAVLRVAPAAAEAASRVGANREAAALLARALEFAAEAPPEVRADLLDRRARALILTDQHEAGIEAELAAIRLWHDLGEPLKEAAALGRLDRPLMFLGRQQEAAGYLERARSLVEPLGRSRELAVVYGNLASHAMLARDLEAALRWGQAALELGHELGDPEIIAGNLNNVGTARARALDDAGITQLDEALALSLEHGLHDQAARAYCSLAAVLAERRLPRAAALLDEALAFTQARELDAYTRYLVPWRAQVRLNRGDFAGAHDDAAEVLGSATPAATSRVPALVVAARVMLRQSGGDVAPLLREAWSMALATGQIQRVAPVACARAEAAWLAGRAADAREPLERALALAADARIPWTRGELAVWAWRAGLAVPLADIARPCELEIAGESREAAAAWQALHSPYEQALALIGAGDEAAVRSGLGVLQRIGATAAAAALRRKLRSSGAVRVPRGARRATRSNPAGLTNRQLDVLRLLASGRPNATIAAELGLSTRTVDHHVSAILEKLGAATRAEAAAIAVARGLATAR